VGCRGRNRTHGEFSCGGTAKNFHRKIAECRLQSKDVIIRLKRRGTGRKKEEKRGTKTCKSEEVTSHEMVNENR